MRGWKPNGCWPILLRCLGLQRAVRTRGHQGSPSPLAGLLPDIVDLVSGTAVTDLQGQAMGEVSQIYAEIGQAEQLAWMSPLTASQCERRFRED